MAINWLAKLKEIKKTILIHMEKGTFEFSFYLVKHVYWTQNKNNKKIHSKTFEVLQMKKSPKDVKLSIKLKHLDLLLLKNIN